MEGMTTTTSSADLQSSAGAIARFDLVVLDTPEPRALADFYCALLGWQIIREDDDWVTIRGDSSAGMAFQLAPNLVPPTWPDPAVPQQFHLDVTVPDLEDAERRVLAIGARLTGQPEQPATFRAYLDPSGHPFCLCLDNG
jgi:catechol-2,3-dioxygenase